LQFHEVKFAENLMRQANGRGKHLIWRYKNRLAEKSGGVKRLSGPNLPPNSRQSAFNLPVSKRPKGQPRQNCISHGWTLQVVAPAPAGRCKLTIPYP
jgi:hypothetical protein